MVRFAKKIRPLIFSLLWTSLLLYYYNLFILGIHAAYVTLFHFRSPKGQFQNCVFDHNFSILWVNGTNWIAFLIFSLKKSVGNCSSFCNTYHLPFTMHELLDCRISEKVSNPPPCDVCSVLALFMVLCRLYSYLW